VIIPTGQIGGDTRQYGYEHKDEHRAQQGLPADTDRQRGTCSVVVAFIAQRPGTGSLVFTPKGIQGGKLQG
jgi:hypothetical protein